MRSTSNHSRTALVITLRRRTVHQAKDYGRPGEDDKRHSYNIPLTRLQGR
jgi:hypothetical protein